MANAFSDDERPVPPPPPEEGGIDDADGVPMGGGDQAPDLEPDPDPIEFDDALDATVDGLPVGKTADCSDVRNAERLIGWFGSNLRHVGKWGKWLTWDGKRWTDNQKRALAAAIRTARMMLDEATMQLVQARVTFDEVRTRDKQDEERIKAEEAVEDAKKYYAHAARSQSSGSIHAMLQVAAADANIAIDSDDLDRDPMLLNVANGTLDLRTGELGPHRREDLISLLCPVAYDHHATAPVWQAFIERAMGGDTMLLLYLQRIAGYFLTGSTKEQALFVFFGGGKNGKSTFVKALLDLVGSDFATPLPRDMAFSSKNDHDTRFALLFRKRLAIHSEIGEGKRLDEALVKDLTGGDRIVARRMREDFWDFEPTHKIVISGNHKPIITGADEGIWRRIRLVPWLVTIPAAEIDKDLPDKLKAEFAGILAWAVNGALEWQRIGLADPQRVTDATTDYRASQDNLVEFFETLEFGPAVKEFCTPKAKMHAAYKAWCESEGHVVLGARRFGDRLRQRAEDQGVELGEKMVRVYDAAFPVRAWCGVRINVGQATTSDYADEHEPFDARQN